ncbi:hypothetical protein C8J56DRAFT_1157748 [Mycena floridula]|nr:hypothetical protein C8J56DRAFT_1157748 [Mycena floridula]
MSFLTVLKRFLRISLYLGITWVLVAIFWLLLPSPTQDVSFPTRTLNSGSVLHRIYTNKLDYYPYTDPWPTVVDSRAGGLTMHLEFKVEEGLLVLGTSLDAWSTPLLYYSRSLLPQQKIALSISSNDNHISVSEPLYFSSESSDELTLPYFILDGAAVLPPWISDADAASIAWWYEWVERSSLWYRPVVTTIRTRIVPAKKTIELWPDSSYWYKVHSTDGTPPGLGPLLTIQLADAASPTFHFPSAPFSGSPSATYNTRIVLLFFLVPVFFLFASIFLIGYGFLLVAPSIFIIAFLALLGWSHCASPTPFLTRLKDFLSRAPRTREQDIQTDDLESQAVDEEIQTVHVEAQEQRQNTILVDV